MSFFIRSRRLLVTIMSSVVLYSMAISVSSLYASSSYDVNPGVFCIFSRIFISVLFVIIRAVRLVLLSKKLWPFVMVLNPFGVVGQSISRHVVGVLSKILRVCRCGACVKGW